MRASTLHDEIMASWLRLHVAYGPGGMANHFNTVPVFGAEDESLSKSILTEYRLELGSFFSLAFGVLTLIGTVGLYMDLGNELPSAISFLEDLATPFGNWVAWIVVVGPIGLVVCVWWVYDYVRKTRELAELIDTPSKAKFVRNLDDIEYLAWSLPQRFEDKVLAKKKEFKL